MVEARGKTTLKYAVLFDGKPVIGASEITFVSSSGETIGADLLSQSDPTFASHDSTWNPVYGERSTIRDNYNQLRLYLADETSGHHMQVEFRCYNAGVAFKTILEAAKTDEFVEITDERSEFRFNEDLAAWRTTAAQGNYDRVRLSRIGSDVERPLVVDAEDNVYAAIAEAALVDYAPMKLRRAKVDPLCLVSQLGGSVHATGKLVTPWRVIMLGSRPGDLLENNDIILNLNEPCAIEDTSWIKPGKVLREISLTTVGAKACVDFAVRNNIQYVEFDAGWYGYEYDDESNAATVTLDPRRSDGPLDLHWVIEYAKQRDVGIILYVNRRALEKQLDELLPLYKKWGIAGVKYGFVNTGTQAWTDWLHNAVRKAAEHELMVDIHDRYRPTGYSRTYPNLMTQEGVRGDEAAPSSSQAITTLFTRNLAGAADHTICYFDPRVKAHWTHGHQLAKAVCTYSPWQFVYWYDSPLPSGHRAKSLKNRIVDTPELEFFAKVPTVWDETRVVHGEIGECAVFARRSGQDWFIGAMNNGEERELGVPLEFLDADVSYKARFYRDDRSLNTDTQIRIDDALLKSESSVTMVLQPNGGQAIWLTPAASVDLAAEPENPRRQTASKDKEKITE